MTEAPEMPAAASQPPPHEVRGFTSIRVAGVDLVRKAEARPFIERFGLRGALWYAEGFSMKQAEELYRLEQQRLRMEAGREVTP